MVLQSVLNILIIDYSGISHNAAEWLDVERLERATDSSSNNQNLILKGGKFVSDGS